MKQKNLIQITTLLLLSFILTTCDFDRSRDASNNRKALLLFFLGQTVTPTSVATVGMYCGSTASLTGAAGGYTTLRTLCQSTCGTTTAHVCGSQEILNTLQFAPSSIPSTLAWYSTHIMASPTDSRYDCINWTSSSAALSGSTTGTTNPTSSACSTSQPFLCCDFNQINQ